MLADSVVVWLTEHAGGVEPSKFADRGQGSYACVKEVVLTMRAAAKVLTHNGDDLGQRCIQTEAAFLRALAHPNIVTVLGWMEVPSKTPDALLMELAKGTLHDLIMPTPTVTRCSVIQKIWCPALASSQFVILIKYL